MKLIEAKLCVDSECNEVIEGDVEICPCCLSEQFIYLIELIEPEFVELRRQVLRNKLRRQNDRINSQAK